jgi:hypothetical protein
MAICSLSSGVIIVLCLFVRADWYYMYQEKIKCPSVRSVILSDMKGATVQEIFLMHIYLKIYNA